MAAFTISDVARRAKVSIGTVSRVMNRPELVRASTRRRVEAVIRRLGYSPNPHARGLMQARSRVLISTVAPATLVDRCTTPVTVSPRTS